MVYQSDGIEVSYCGGCYCMTKSIRIGRAHNICGKCEYDKTLGDLLQSELEREEE